MSHNLQGTFATEIHVPDTYGVFKFVVDYKRLGYSYIELSEQVPVRPFKHNEFERFILSAFPYYTSALSCMAAFFVFSFVFLYGK
jgi:oligosaccharyltransferase complex subunit beta